MPGTIYYKVYCGSNGKTYNFKSENKARELYNEMIMRNYHTRLYKVENGKEELLDKFV